MPSQILSAALLVLSVSLPIAHTYKVTYYTGLGCRGQRLAERDFVPEGCSTELNGNAGSISVTNSSANDNGYIMVKFSSNDCNPDNEVAHFDEGDQGRTCVDGSFGSLQAWDLYNI